MPVRNLGRYLPLALDSILAQDGVDIEVIVVDDGSTDDTASILDVYQRSHSALRVLRTGGEGISRALNLALEAARGAYVARMDGDDIALPERLAKQLCYLEANPQIGVLGSQANIIDEYGTLIRRMHVPVGPTSVREALNVSSPMINPTLVMRRALAEEVGGYQAHFDGAEDYDLILRLSRLTEIDNLPDVLLLYRRHSQQTSTRRAFRQAQLASLSYVLHTISMTTGAVPLTEPQHFAQWRSVLRRSHPWAVEQVRQLTASRLADNGGTLTRFGARYFDIVSRSVAKAGAPEIRRRMALAVVRHQLQLLRAGRWRRAFWAAASDIVRWRQALLGAYLRHASILWRARYPARLPSQATVKG